MTEISEPAVKGLLAADPNEFRPDPHAGFAKYRPLAALIDFGEGTPFVTRHGDVVSLMTDPRTRQMETEPLHMRGITAGGLHTFYANSMLLSNPPAHARRRRPAARAFAFKLIQAWRPRIRALVSEMIDAIAGRQELDFLEAIASPLPSRLIAEIIGAPEQDAFSFATKVYTMSRGLGAFRPAEFEAIDAAAADLIAYVEDLLDDRRRSPREDFLSDYLASVREAGELSEAETLVQIVTLILAGSDTTRFGLTVMVSLLLQHRAQWEAVCADPSRAAGAVLEALRFEPPVGAIGRVVTELLSVDGAPVTPGTVLSLSILSAQRDETVYAMPQRFDIGRDDHPRWSVTFGYGAHRCLGEALARAEMEEALIALTQKLPALQLIGPPPAPRGHTGIRGITPMRVGWTF